jgi:cytochrome c peroxidase
MGIPGEGPLQLAQIKAWLADPQNHEPLEFVLPVGLRDEAAEIVIPEDNPLTRAKIELGRQLFFDKRLSDGTFSCATCHQPEQFYSSYQVMPEVRRNASTAFNRILGREHFWDGRADSLESQPHSPVENPFEMNSSPEETTASVAAIDGYVLQFEAIFGAVSFTNICRALASFERVIVTGPAAWDYHRLQEGRPPAPVGAAATELDERSQITPQTRGRAMSDAAVRGESLFFSDRAGCGNCHTGANLTDEQFHNLGVGTDAARPDEGRMKVTGDGQDRGAFKTPTLRNVAQTPPYMHNGQFSSLEQVIEFLDHGGGASENISPLIRPLGLSAGEKADLIEFLNSLTSELPPVETGRLPE